MIFTEVARAYLTGRFLGGVEIRGRTEIRGRGRAAGEPGRQFRDLP